LKVCSLKTDALTLCQVFFTTIKNKLSVLIVFVLYRETLLLLIVTVIREEARIYSQQ